MSPTPLSYVGFSAAKELLYTQKQHARNSSLPLADEQAFATAIEQLKRRPGLREVLQNLPRHDPFLPGLRPRAIAHMVRSVETAAKEIVRHVATLDRDMPRDKQLITALNANPAAGRALGRIVESGIKPAPHDFYSPAERASRVMDTLRMIAGNQRPC